MLALLYLILAIYLGDQFSRRFFRYVSVAQRCATAVLVGLFLSSWFSYLAAWLFRRTATPLFWSNLCFFLAAAAAWIGIRRRRARRGIHTDAQFVLPRVPGSALWDWVTLIVFFILACWMMFATLGYRSATGTLLIGNNEWSDFGPHTAIIQSFAVGHNFPTEYPHFAGEPIRYHFLFYFQAGNLTYLGFNLACSLNLLSIITLVAMLTLVMTLGQLLFYSRTVGRLGAVLFFFHGTLSFVAFLRSQPSFKAALHSIVTLKDFLPSGYPYRGELWGIWTQVVYLNQRHFASGLGILLIVLLFLFDRYRQHYATKTAAAVAPEPINGSDIEPPFPPPSWEERPPVEPDKPGVSLFTRLRGLSGRLIEVDKSFLFAGCLLGLLPFWNALIFTAAFAILAGFFLLFPCRRQLVALGLMTAVIALPQLVLIQSGGAQTPTHSLLHWGYVIDQPTWGKIIRYIGFSFGLKLGLAALALVFASWFQIRFFLTLCVLWVITFSLQLSVEGLANHKFLNVWLIISNLFVAYALWRLWRLPNRWLRVVSKPAAAVAAAAIFLGGAIDLFPIHNSYWIDMKFARDPLVKWIQENTRPHDVFLSDRFVNHQILLAGRRIFYGWPSFAWSSGYDTTLRDREYREFFESMDPYAVFRLLRKHKIAYVAIDDAVRHSDFIKQTNEKLYALNCPKVWEDKNSEYNALVIYKVPDPPPKVLKLPQPAPQMTNAPAVTMFQGGRGAGKGQFDFPRGMTTDAAGNFFVADTNNGRVQKFSPTGAFIMSVGSEGKGPGQFSEPNAVAVDAAGNLYVTEAGNHRVQKLSPNGTFLSEWKGPTPGFYGPRKIAPGPENSLYVVDQGRTRVVRFGYDGQVLVTWGSKGSGEGQFDDPTSVAIDPGRNRVYVADPRNKRIQVFDSGGKFLGQWPVAEWGSANGYEDLAVDVKSGRVYASSAHMNTVLVYDPDGKRVASMVAKAGEKFEGATALVVLNDKLYVLCAGSSRVVQIDLP
jgi:DNA-binding beta-propeller fold protein YncE